MVITLTTVYLISATIALSILIGIMYKKRSPTRNQKWLLMMIVSLPVINTIFAVIAILITLHAYRY